MNQINLTHLFILHLALLARSVLGIGRVCSWYDALYDNVKNDAGQELNFFELIQSKTYGETHSVRSIYDMVLFFEIPSDNMTICYREL